MLRSNYRCRRRSLARIAPAVHAARLLAHFAFNHLLEVGDGRELVLGSRLLEQPVLFGTVLDKSAEQISNAGETFLLGLRTEKTATVVGELVGFKMMVVMVVVGELAGVRGAHMVFLIAVFVDADVCFDLAVIIDTAVVEVVTMPAFVTLTVSIVVAAAATDSVAPVATAAVTAARPPSSRHAYSEGARGTPVWSPSARSTNQASAEPHSAAVSRCAD